MRHKFRFLNSIRWRLPLSYAAIALLATVALGVLLLSTLRSYYDAQEREYLQNNADVMARRLERLYHGDVDVEYIAAEVNNLAFFTHVSVRLLSPERDVIVHSENPLTFEISRVPINLTSFGSYQASGGENAPTEWIASIGPVSSGTVEVGDGETNVVGGIPGDPPPRNVNITFGEGIWLDNGPLGFRLRMQEPSPTELSDQVVMVPIEDQKADVVFGYLELSQGPAFGDEIVDSVARQFVGASVAAVTLAAMMGWVVSRRISQPVLALSEVTGRMAEGELSARADTGRRDEIGLLSRSFNRMAQRIEKTVITLRQFVADAAHELNTPITALQTNLELAASETNPRERRQYITQAQTQLGRLESLTNSLLALARLEASDARHFDEVDLASLVRSVYETYASSADQKELELTVAIENESLAVEANADQLQQVLENLLDNAIKFTPNGGKVSLRLHATEQVAHLAIEDTGIGIPDNDLPRLFQRFHRGRNAAAYSGNGLGLVISKAIIEGHRGTIQAENYEQGTRFLICIPIRQSEEGNCKDASQSHPTH